MPERLQYNTTCGRPMHKGVSGRAGHGADGTKHALLAEHVRIKHLEKALDCASDGLFREYCEAGLSLSMAHALHLERAIRAAADATEQGQGHSDLLQLGECLLSAMDMARANGGVSATETVAPRNTSCWSRCCRTLLDTQPFESAGRPREQAGFLDGAMAP